MENNTLALEDNIKLDNILSINIKNEIEKTQTSFLESTLGATINSAIDIALKAILPDLVEDQVISIKNTILEQGFSAGINEAIESGIDLGKSAIGIFTGHFENISQVEKAVEKGGVLDAVSSLFDKSIEIAKKENLINSSVAKMIKEGKNTIINSIRSKIEDTLTNQVKSLEKLNTYCEKWNGFYENREFAQMETAYKNIHKYLNTVIPIENTINEARRIENLHNLIKNNGRDFNITEEEQELTKRLAIS